MPRLPHRIEMAAKGVEVPALQSPKAFPHNRGARHSMIATSAGYQFSVTAHSFPRFPFADLEMVSGDLSDNRIRKKEFGQIKVARTIKSTYKTAWYICHRIRAAMREVRADLLKGIVEVDETWLGGQVHGKNFMRNKTLVIGAIEREGQCGFKFMPARGLTVFWLTNFLTKTTTRKQRRSTPTILWKLQRHRRRRYAPRNGQSRRI